MKKTRMTIKAQLRHSLKPFEIDTNRLMPVTTLNIRNGFLSNSRWQIRKERPNRPTNNGDKVDKAKHDVMSE